MSRLRELVTRLVGSAAPAGEVAVVTPGPGAAGTGAPGVGAPGVEAPASGALAPEAATEAMAGAPQGAVVGAIAASASEAASGAASPDRRQVRTLEPRLALREHLAEKVLYGWVQNRHQTLFPLTVNLRTLEPERAGVLLRVAALAVTALGPAGAERVEAARAWLRSAGAGSEGVGVFDAALDAPPPLGPLMQEVQRAGLGAYAYAVALGTVDQRDPAGQRLLDFLAARLGVPSHIVRSVSRRYRA